MGMTDTDIYLDVDGVLNAVSVRDPESWGWGGSNVVRANGFSIRYSPVAVERLNALAARPDVHMRWLTTWLNDAPQLLAPMIGLEGQGWPVLGQDEHDDAMRSGVGPWWKFSAVRRHFETTGHRAVWIDDDLGYDEQARGWAAPYVDDGSLLLVQPLTHVALTKAEFDGIEAWIGSPT